MRPHFSSYPGGLFADVTSFSIRLKILEVNGALFKVTIRYLAGSNFFFFLGAENFTAKRIAACSADIPYWLNPGFATGTLHLWFDAATTRFENLNLRKYYLY